MTLSPDLHELPDDLKPLMEGGTPFARTLGAHLVSRGDGQAVLAVDAPVALHNHVGGPHAATLFGLAETAAAAVILTVFEDLFRDGAVPLIKSAEISYKAIATGEVTATARFTGDADGVRQSMTQRGVAVFPVEVSLATADGTECASFTAHMALKRF
jgi:acyl-coenzyme A thioesterase PaaI-like protein